MEAGLRSDVVDARRVAVAAAAGGQGQERGALSVGPASSPRGPARRRPSRAAAPPCSRRGRRCSISRRPSACRSPAGPRSRRRPGRRCGPRSAAHTTHRTACCSSPNAATGSSRSISPTLAPFHPRSPVTNPSRQQATRQQHGVNRGNQGNNQTAAAPPHKLTLGGHPHGCSEGSARPKPRWNAAATRPTWSASNTPIRQHHGVQPGASTGWSSGGSRNTPGQ